jgi:hypothetical protein
MGIPYTQKEEAPLMKRFLLLAILLAVSSPLVFSESRTQGQIWLSYSRPEKEALITGFFLAVEYIKDGLDDVARRFRADHPDLVFSGDPPGAPVEKKSEYDMEVLVKKMDAFYRRPGNADVPLKNAIVMVCITGKEKEKDKSERR